MTEATQHTLEITIYILNFLQNTTINIAPFHTNYEKLITLLIHIPSLHPSLYVVADVWRDFLQQFLQYRLEKEMATYSRVLAWGILWTEEPGRLVSIGLYRVGHDCRDLAWHGTQVCWHKILFHLKIYLFNPDFVGYFHWTEFWDDSFFFLYFKEILLFWLQWFLMGNRL